MARYAQVQSGNVINVADSATPITGWIECPPEVQVGWYYDAATGTFTELPMDLESIRARKQADLDLYFDNFCELRAFVRNGSATNVTANGVGSFLASITNTYRTKRAAIAAATTVAGVDAVTIDTGWPANP